MQTLTTTFEPSSVGRALIQSNGLKSVPLMPYSAEQELSSRQISHYIDKPRFRETGYNTTTFGHIGFTRVEATERVTDDILLQARLDILCDKLRAKY